MCLAAHVHCMPSRAPDCTFSSRCCNAINCGAPLCNASLAASGLPSGHPAVALCSTCCLDACAARLHATNRHARRQALVPCSTGCAPARCLLHRWSANTAHGVAHGRFEMRLSTLLLPRCTQARTTPKSAAVYALPQNPPHAAAQSMHAHECEPRFRSQAHSQTARASPQALPCAAAQLACPSLAQSGPSHHRRHRHRRHCQACQSEAPRA